MFKARVGVICPFEHPDPSPESKHCQNQNAAHENEHPGITLVLQMIGLNAALGVGSKDVLHQEA